MIAMPLILGLVKDLSSATKASIVLGQLNVQSKALPSYGKFVAVVGNFTSFGGTLFTGSS